MKGTLLSSVSLPSNMTRSNATMPASPTAGYAAWSPPWRTLSPAALSPLPMVVRPARFCASWRRSGHGVSDRSRPGVDHRESTSRGCTFLQFGQCNRVAAPVAHQALGQTPQFLLRIAQRPCVLDGIEGIAHCMASGILGIAALRRTDWLPFEHVSNLFRPLDHAFEIPAEH